MSQEPSKAIIIPYRAHQGSGLCPVAEIEVAFGPRKLRVEGIIDSGASSCVFPRELLTYLGLPIDKVKEENVGQASGKKWPILWFPKFVLKARLGQYEFPVFAAFHKDPNPDAPTLFGRRDFFKAFVVTIDEEAQVTRINPNKNAKLPSKTSKKSKAKR